ncbi:fatty acid desaturase [Aureococcus anophagefferens]|nr:fatty acid desaturase [Aureococcus anophagefferens]
MAAVGRRCASPAHGWGAFAYFALSAANSVGFLAHPCIGFWLFQHACATDLDERSSMAAAYRAAKGPRPKFYAPTHVYHVPSIATLLATWLKGKREKFDFACRKRLVARARDRAVELSVAHVAPAKH